ncbi:hypothetical protein GCM10007938_43160 [Vibrio zhanjiangensis]|uniref:DUF4255 domain-containing protein n=1 Tax=Vibrio zhanjiangensis TaxID=1046128 RepID=A0ABQ6F6G1_9VIBR|nr:hypothetical protein [Vibrio zhanjiangensis]GLT20531.1 hypothetical protein GCM10007938_43160 [Vibrio zhanjiangensis]
MNINMHEYHEAIKNWLQGHEQISSWFKLIDRYPEESTKLTTPFLLYSVGDWDKDSEQPAGGQKAWNLSLTFHIGINNLEEDNPENTGADLQILLRDLAMAACAYLDESRFGLKCSVGDVVVSSCEYDALSPELDEYLVYVISANQRFLTNKIDPCLSSELYNPHGIAMAGFAPRIGSGHKDDYEQLYPEYEGS